MKTVNVKPHQCLLDISMQEKGSIAALFDFAVANGRSITDEFIAGESLLIPDTEIIDMRTWQELQEDGIIPANGYTADDAAYVMGGIGYMGIQLDFRIS
ncbi:hypothetical protein [Chitinophaga silvisoli]|uniref:Uncharacterized protein n=1 Tax=Chitinophaga silvisoli TaxID=2291814 RepID=A0A3E1NWF6_9BACT|nr:hypothetical protein [Chitinophaga silvisoli]RFM32266.1 hypothetical protein DXN04_26185 [Chitinophaga silvisoli]